MPIRKFRSFDEMNRPVWREPGDPALYAAIRAVWDFGQKTSRIRFRPGVYCFRTVDDMQRHRPHIVIDIPSEPEPYTP